MLTEQETAASTLHVPWIPMRSIECLEETCCTTSVVCLKNLLFPPLTCVSQDMTYPQGEGYHSDEASLTG